jgi:cyclophilin family peptidyl-prolyl cis-trans isomerase
MKKISLLGVATLLVLGCGGTIEEKVIKKQNQLNEATAEKLENAQDISVLRGYKKEQAALFQELRQLPQHRLEKFDARFRRETAESNEKLQEALVKLRERLKSGDGNPVVLMETSLGPVTIELFPKLAPITVKNFLDYVDDKFYDGTIFHRVIRTFMIQGGGFESGMRKEKPMRPSIENESYNGLTNDRGTIAMARTPQPDSATAQFFINVVDNSMLDRANAKDRVGYAVFGKVIDGMDVVDRIREVKTRNLGDHEDVPADDVLIKSIRRVEKKK